MRNLITDLEDFISKIKATLMMLGGIMDVDFFIGQIHSSIRLP